LPVGFGVAYLYLSFVRSRAWVKVFITQQMLSCNMRWSRFFGISSVCCLSNLSLYRIVLNIFDSCLFCIMFIIAVVGSLCANVI